MRSTSYIPNSSLPPPPKPIGGSMRITDQVIEEVDEQLTISQMTQSRKDFKDNAVQKGGPGSIYLRSYSSVSGGLTSPLESPNINESVSIGKDDMSRATVEDDVDDDDFEKLRKTRELKRHEKAQLKLARSISTHPGVLGDGDPRSSTIFSSEPINPALFRRNDDCEKISTGNNRKSIKSDINIS
uniref:Uncharacterized protein n=1 Tax=Megaselia scalaris TaxID=36166 RepID=T1GVR5_MEGSC